MPRQSAFLSRSHPRIWGSTAGWVRSRQATMRAFQPSPSARWNAVRSSRGLLHRVRYLLKYTCMHDSSCYLPLLILAYPAWCLAQVAWLWSHHCLPGEKLVRRLACSLTPWVHTYILTYLHYIYAYIYAYMHAYIHTRRRRFAYQQSTLHGLTFSIHIRPALYHGSGDRDLRRLRPIALSPSLSRPLPSLLFSFSVPPRSLSARVCVYVCVCVCGRMLLLTAIPEPEPEPEPMPLPPRALDSAAAESLQLG